LYKNRSYEISLIDIEETTSKVRLRINSKLVELKLKSDRQLLLEKMGLSSLTVKKVSEVKAPMPGLVVRCIVEVEQEVEQGDALLVLEAMKMENIIKSPTAGVISQIMVIQGEAVEKNQILIKFK
jgi:biotin carboxyl carrier protein